MNEPQKRRTGHLAFILTMHTKNRAIQTITRLSDPVNGLEIWRRFLEVREPVNRGRFSNDADAIAAMTSHEKLRSSLGGVERRIWTQSKQQCWHNPQDPEWCRYAILSATRLQRHDAHKKCVQRERQRQEQTQRQRQAKMQREKQAQRPKKKEKARIS